VLNTVAGIFVRKPIQKLAGLFTKPEEERKKEGVVLPDYA